MSRDFESVCSRQAWVRKAPARRLRHVLFMDVDGTLTDGKVYIGNDGEFIKAFNIKDEYAIAHLLQKHNILPVIITGRISEIVSKRCQELGINFVLQNVSNKREKMIEFANSYEIYENEQGVLLNTYYIGDDIPDFKCMLMAEKKGCPADAVNKIKAVSGFVSSKNGGDGAVREFVEWVCRGN